ncbi:DUF4136 domain-containing protein [Cytophagaceae bacterium DM2B3-1]|uniref:DUF4136 domain-containing protein n=1 Tax=Xanthocytophaga flava TaxID=3048013 RepID=A0AAE3QUP6_9BACT|nr:DUF4136 domain-containing protein [Xanthocytophaga flavus]MDJ1483830.1 DUF4136 domain-containing protein [Xanthocytophaga flavus]MDJ1494054.1 DUF4136 domain-containing protein [Xanthocytophaga flavus]
MKLKILIIGLLVSIQVMAQKQQKQNVQVNSDKQLNIDWSKYKTYAWASQVDSKLDPGIYFLNDLVLKERIRNAVGYEMDGRGYEKVSQSPDIIVNFRVFDQPTTLKGYTGYGTSYWGSQEVRQPEDTTSYNVERGTLIVNVIDTKSGETIWRGFASGLMNGTAFNKEEEKIKEAVNLIYQDYPARADNLGNKK